MAMSTRVKQRDFKTSNYPAQKRLSEYDLLRHLENHFSGRPASRIYLAPNCYINADFFESALRGMLKSFENCEAYEVCARVYRLLEQIEQERRSP